MSDYRYPHEDARINLGPCLYEVECLDLSDFGFPGLSFSGHLHIEIDSSLGDDDWYLECATAAGPNGSHKLYALKDKKSAEPSFEHDMFSAIERAVLADKRLCDFIYDMCKEHA